LRNNALRKASHPSEEQEELYYKRCILSKHSNSYKKDFLTAMYNFPDFEQIWKGLIDRLPWIIAAASPKLLYMNSCMCWSLNSKGTNYETFTCYSLAWSRIKFKLCRFSRRGPALVARDILPGDPAGRWKRHDAGARMVGGAARLRRRDPLSPPPPLSSPALLPQMLLASRPSPLPSPLLVVLRGAAPICENADDRLYRAFRTVNLCHHRRRVYASPPPSLRFSMA
jgi:hypothetical protein